MGVVIQSVNKGSPADKIGLRDGDILLSIGDNDIVDVLDYQFYAAESNLRIHYERDGKRKTALVRKGEYEDLGLEFESYLMDRQQRCKNNCVFCFIDQLPKGMRETLYFKDDDARLSFLFGNYITLTNLSRRDVDRIIKMKISPVNISVHTTDPELRVRMMGNRFAGERLSIMDEFAAAGIHMNCQLVLCPGINDGEKLKESLEYLGKLHPWVQSVAAVPVGLTKHREGLAPLIGYSKETAGGVIDVIEKFGDRFLKENGTRLAYPADEFFLKAERPVPGYDYYEDFLQIENGVGMMAQFKREFMDALEDAEGLNASCSKKTVVTGSAAKNYLQTLIDCAIGRWHNLQYQLCEIKNCFFGETITVAGLLTGGDIMEQLKEKDLGECVLLPRSALRHEGDLFLDGVSIPQMEQTLGVPVVICDVDGGDFFSKLIGRT